ncbi:hypothetical protein [Psychrobacter sp. FME61]|uniref:hypothetical protein n=1 Tax=unclassified Psychrobacter TaxID=196806 RepID=UPI00186702EF|nr:hypothetical protein [Psychrobacter sp. FME61]
MRKWLYTVVLMGVTSATNANDFDPMDKYFAEFEIVDENYHYVDLDGASTLLDLVQYIFNKKIKNEQPEFKFGDKNYFMSWYIDLYSSSIAVKNVEPSFQESGINELCNSFYGAKYQAANNIVVKLSSYDNQDNLVETMVLNKDVCAGASNL